MRTAVNDVTTYRAAGSFLVLLTSLILFGMVPRSVGAQNLVTLPQLVLEPNHTEYVSTRNPDTANIGNVRSSNPSVATARVYRVRQVQIVAVDLGKTEVEFFDTVEHVTYQVSVWVEKPNSTGGGGAGYEPGRTQLTQVVMLVKHAQNVTVPGGGSHQLSSVTSSNPSVATARTNTRSTIQIYSVALGDTFVNFTDNATGTRFQVHVWVVKNLSDPIGGDGGGNPLSGGPKPSPTPKPKPGPIGGGGGSNRKIDSCLVGTWRSESVLSGGKRGGAGIVLTVKADGEVTIDYSAMQELKAEVSGRVVGTTSWSGSATGHITASDGVVSVGRVEQTALTFKNTGQYGTKTGALGGLGPVLAKGPYQLSYTCDDGSLIIKPSIQGQSVETYTFRREK